MEQAKCNPMTPHEAVIELAHAVAAAIVKYEKAVPGICVGIFVDRDAVGFKVRPRIRTRAALPDQHGPAGAGRTNPKGSS